MRFEGLIYKTHQTPPWWRQDSEKLNSYQKVDEDNFEKKKPNKQNKKMWFLCFFSCLSYTMNLKVIVLFCKQTDYQLLKANRRRN